MSTDPIITDRRDEITHNHIPDGLADRRDSGGNIVLGEVRYGHRPVAPEPDELTPFLARTKVKPRDLPSYTGGDAVTYCAKVAGLPAIAKAAAREAKATAAWRDAEAQLRDARTKLRESCRGWRTDAAIKLNQGGALDIPQAVRKEWQELDAQVRMLEAILGPTTEGSALKCRPTSLRGMILGDAVARLSFEEAADLLFAAQAVGAHQGARRAAGLPPAKLPTSTIEVSQLIRGTRPGSPSWMRDNKAERRRMFALDRQLAPILAELREEIAAQTRQRMVDAAA